MKAFDITMILKFVILILCFYGACMPQASATAATDSLMGRLDEVIANREETERLKEERIARVRAEQAEAKDDRELFNSLVHLYDEYLAYNADSAYNISLRQKEVAARSGDPELLTHARMNLANILSATGMYHETLQIIDSVRFEELPGYLRPYYFHIKRTVYGRLADYAAFAKEKERYNRLTAMYRDSIVASNASNSLANVITRADILNLRGKPREAIGTLMRFMDENELSEHEKAICAWTLSESYALTGENALRKEQLLISSISDLKASVREYMSLRQLALLLYEEGDLDRAYRFMTIAVDDATRCNARQRIIELNDYYPRINGIYVNQVKKQKKSLERTIIIITVLSLMLLAMIFYMRKQMIRIARARKETEAAYQRLNAVTAQLKMSNDQLSEANNAIAEISELKEVYIGRYMDQCLVYIDKLDSYRKSIGKLINTNKTDDLKKLVKSTTLVDDELRNFYDQFDRTFLSLFPTFVDDFNSLLSEGEAIIPKKEGSLNTELRIFALIRLGISDSDRIAKFLRYSLTTIYNYRTKVRNKARGDRAMLEAEVMKIGKSKT